MDVSSRAYFYDLRKTWICEGYSSAVTSPVFQAALAMYNLCHCSNVDFMSVSPNEFHGKEFDARSYTAADIEWWAVCGDCVECSGFVMPALYEAVHGSTAGMYVLSLDFERAALDTHCVLASRSLAPGTVINQVLFGTRPRPADIVLYDLIYSVYRPPEFGRAVVVACSALEDFRETIGF